MKVTMCLALVAVIFISATMSQQPQPNSGKPVSHPHPLLFTSYHPKLNACQVLMVFDKVNVWKWFPIIHLNPNNLDVISVTDCFT